MLKKTNENEQKSVKETYRNEKLHHGCSFTEC